MNSFIRIFESSVTLSELKAKQFHQEIKEEVIKGTNLVILDLKNVDFMDSSGLGALVKIHTKIHSSGGKLCLCSISEQVKMLFELTSLNNIFEILEDRAENDEIFSQSSPKARDVREYAKAILA